MSSLAAAAGVLRSAHEPGAPLVLANVWDPPSARLVERAGFPIAATSSAAMLASVGCEDGGSAPPDTVFAAVAQIAAAVRVPVTADIEDGYGLDATDLVSRLLGAGAVGCNLEDSDHSHPGGLVDPTSQAQRITAIKAAGRTAGVDVVVNARIDTYIAGSGDPSSRLDDALRRAEIYVGAGADCVYPILIPDDQAPGFLMAHRGPVNMIANADADAINRLAALGAARISLGPRLWSETFRLAGALLDDLCGRAQPARTVKGSSA